jgi:hypothetical protein
MAYVLRAAVARASVISSGSIGTELVPLPQGFVLAPLVAASDKDPVGLFYRLTDDLARQLAVLSAAGPLAYLEAEFFGGAGTQSAIAWQDGKVIFGPLHTQSQDGEEVGYVTPGRGDMAINQVLRVLGVTAQGVHDEFAALGLGRFRDTAEWTTRP